MFFINTADFINIFMNTFYDLMWLNSINKN